MVQKKVTVIGGSGFVGTNLCMRLQEQNWDFEIVDLKISNRFPEKSKIGDVRDISSLNRTITGEIVINLAAVHRDDVSDKLEYHSTNVDGAKNIAEVCKNKKIMKIIFTSSVAVYGFAKPGTDESGSINPFNEYGRTKFAAEEVFRLWQKDSDNSLAIVRPTVIFGEGNRGNVFNLLNQIASGRFLMVGNGENKKSMAYIGNVVAFLEKCLASQKSYILYNYVDDPVFTMNDLVLFVRKKLKDKNNVGFRLPYFIAILIGYIADTLSRITKKNFFISSIRIKKFTSTSEFSSSAKNLDEFEPPFSLQDGLNRVLESEFIVNDPHREIFFTE